MVVVVVAMGRMSRMSGKVSLRTIWCYRKSVLPILPIFTQKIFYQWYLTSFVKISFTP